MAHNRQQAFCEFVKRDYPRFFEGQRVLDVGSLNINGSFREHFDDCEYVGIDLDEGPDVDIVAAGHLYDEPDGSFDVVVSGECFEHNAAWRETFLNMVRLTRSGGLVLFTCAAPGRAEHGTPKTTPENSPFTGDHYENVGVFDFACFGEAWFRDTFDFYSFIRATDPDDLYFHGVKA